MSTVASTVPSSQEITLRFKYADIHYEYQITVNSADLQNKDGQVRFKTDEVRDRVFAAIRADIDRQLASEPAAASLGVAPAAAAAAGGAGVSSPSVERETLAFRQAVEVSRQLAGLKAMLQKKAGEKEKGKRDSTSIDDEMKLLQPLISSTFMQGGSSQDECTRVGKVAIAQIYSGTSLDEIACQQNKGWITQYGRLILYAAHLRREAGICDMAIDGQGNSYVELNDGSLLQFDKEGNCVWKTADDMRSVGELVLVDQYSPQGPTTAAATPSSILALYRTPPRTELATRLEVLHFITQLQECNLSTLAPRTSAAALLYGFLARHLEMRDQLWSISCNLREFSWATIIGKVEQRPPSSLTAAERVYVIQSLQEQYRLSKDNSIKELSSSAGHGGNKAATIGSEGNLQYVFLKPFDPVEYNGYRIMRALDTDNTLAPFLSEVHGIVTFPDAKGQLQQYMVLDNILMKKDGSRLTQVADLKLAARDPGDLKFHPIYSVSESITTRGKQKASTTEAGMFEGVQRAPGYLMTVDVSGVVELIQKMGRAASYPLSEVHLFFALQNATSEQIAGIIQQLRALQTALSQMAIAHIGSSIAIIQDGDHYQVKLIDPAHIQVHADQMGALLKSGISGSKVYTSASTASAAEEYTQRKASNQRSMDLLIGSLEKLRAGGLPSLLNQAGDTVSIHDWKARNPADISALYAVSLAQVAASTVVTARKLHRQKTDRSLPAAGSSPGSAPPVERAKSSPLGRLPRQGGGQVRRDPMKRDDD